MTTFRCDDIVARAADLGGPLSGWRSVPVDDHLRLCPACRNYLGQIQLLARLLAQLPVEPLSGDLELNLLAMYRTWAASVRI